MDVVHITLIHTVGAVMAAASSLKHSRGCLKRVDINSAMLRALTVALRHCEIAFEATCDEFSTVGMTVLRLYKTWRILSLQVM